MTQSNSTRKKAVTAAKSETLSPKTDTVESTKIAAERDKIAHAGAFQRGATWILARFPLTKNKYQNWTSGRRILVGYILWFILLPIIPIAGAIIWFLHDPEGFKKSPWAKGLLALVILWAGAFGVVATSPAQLDQNGKYSPVQTVPNGETAGSVTQKPASAATEESKQKVAKQTASKPSTGRTFQNCTEAFDAGVFDIKRSDSAYQSKLDRDSDGIACER